MDKSVLDSFLIKGDIDSFTKIFNAYFTPLAAYIMQYTHDRSEAEDIVQNCFIKLWEKRENLHIHTSLKSYLYGSAYNLFIDKYRKGKVMDAYVESLKEQALEEIGNLPENDMARQLELLDKAIQELPPKCRKIFILNKKEGLSYKEVAKQLNISAKTVEAQLRIALIKLRERFKSDPLIVYLLMG